MFAGLTMAELLWAAVIALAFGALAATTLVPWDLLVESGMRLMLGSAAFALPIEAVYFALLWRALRRDRPPPRGWYWRTFDHHHLLDRGQRRYVLPLFYVGAVGFAGISLGIGVVLLGFVAAARQS